MFRLTEALFFSVTVKSKNRKTKIASTMSGLLSCSPACALFKRCYAFFGKVNYHWLAVSAGKRSYATQVKNILRWKEYLTALRSLVSGSLLRLNVSGDLPGKEERLDMRLCRSLAAAVSHLRCFTYSHKQDPNHRAIAQQSKRKQRAALALARINLRKIEALNRESSLTISLSANSYGDLDRLVEDPDRKRSPLVVIVRRDQAAGKRADRTAADNKIVFCPAQTNRAASCFDCGERFGEPLCLLKDRSYAIGFIAHGWSKSEVEKASRETDQAIVSLTSEIKRDRKRAAQCN